MKKFLEVGKIVAAQGLKGEVRVNPWCEPFSFLCNFKELYFDENGENKIKVRKSRVQKNVVIVHFESINTIEDAQKLLGKTLYINRNDAKLDDDEFFIQDIIGLNVFDYNTNKNYGIITDVLKTGANDVYEITDENSKKYLIPAIKDVVIEINILENMLKIVPIDGLFGD